jgi:HEAT repeat protein
MTNALSRDERVKEIRFILKDLLKVIKVVSLYPESNPLPQSMKRSFAERLVDIVRQYGLVAVTVKKDALQYEKEEVFLDRTKEESLAAIFFDNGITDFTFRDDMEVEDVYRLLEAIKDHVNSPRKSQDLAAQIWEAEVTGLTFSTLEDVSFSEYNEGFNLQEYTNGSRDPYRSRNQPASKETDSYEAIFDLKREENVVSLDDGSPTEAGQGGGQRLGQSRRSMFYAVRPEGAPGTVFDDKGVDGVTLRTGEAAQAMGYKDITPGRVSLPDTALILNEEFKLSQEEETSVGRLLSEDAEFEIYESTLELLKEMLFQEIEMNGFYETVTICEKVMTEFLQDGKLEYAAHVLQYLKELDGRIRSEKPLWAERLRDSLVTAGSRNRLKALVTGLNDRPEIDEALLFRYLDNFGWEVLGGLTDLLGELEHRQHRETLCDFLAKKGKNHPDVVAKGIYDKRWFVVRNAVNILVRIGDDAALNHLKHALQHKERRVRLELVKSLKDCANENVPELLLQIARDPDKEIRSEAIESISARGGSEAFAAVAELIHDEGFIQLDQEEQVNLLRTFSALGGDQAVGFLSRLILKFNPFRNATLIFYRRSAFEALCHNRSEQGERLLIQLASSWRPDIRRQASAAIRRRRELTFGDQS